MNTKNFSDNPKKYRREISKLLSAIESQTSFNLNSPIDVIAHNSNSKIIGITGAPGAGKSSLINNLIEELSKDDLSIGILAIDPSSPFSGGAILGDRTRMHSAGMYEKLYIRSSSTRGHLGGLSAKTPEMLSVLTSYNFDIIIIETVGVGQAELDIMKCAHMTCVVLSPNMGDALQAIKAGLIEIADLFILNKADIPAIHELEKDIIFSLSLGGKDAKKPRIIKTSALRNDGILELKNEIFIEYKALKERGDIEKRVKDGLDFQIELNLQYCLSTMLEDSTLQSVKENLKTQVYAHTLSPKQAATQIFDEVIKRFSQKK